MLDDIVERWLASARYAEIENLRVRPVPHRLFPGKPLSIQRGQAVVFVVRAEDGTWWILKKFLAGKGLDRAYLCAVTRVLPCHPALASGTDRRVLGASSTTSNGKTFHETAFTQWLDGAILMPRVEGCDWASVADGLRDGSLQLQPGHRLALCHQLCELVALLSR